MTSLRARKKQATARGLANAAYELALQNGLDSVTTEEIASRAGVSRRTFANYYPNKHAAVVDGFLHTLGIPVQRPEESICINSLPECFGELITIVEDFIRTLFSDATMVRHMQEFATMMTLHPGLEPYLHAIFHEFENSDAHEVLELRFGRARVSIFFGAAFGSLGGLIRLLLGPVFLPRPNGSTATPPVLSDTDFKAVGMHIDQAFEYLRDGFLDSRTDNSRA